jgi:putative ABC transport system permease protein
LGVIREVKQSILGKKVLYFIVYIQLVMVFFATINAGIRISYITDYLIKIRNVVEPTWVKPRIADMSKYNELRESPELLDEIYEFFQNHNDVAKIGGIDEECEIELNPNSNDIIISKPSELITTVFVEKIFLESLSKKIKSGRNLEDEDYHEGIRHMPVLVSYNLRRKYKVGSIVEDKYEVVGVLKRNAVMPYAFNNFKAFGTIDFNYIVTPKLPTVFGEFPEHFTEEKIKELKEITDFNERFATIYIELKDESLIEGFAEAIAQKSNEIGMPILIESLNKTSKERIREDLPRILPTIFVAGITIVLAIIGQIAVNLSLLLRKKREFGIRLACGASLASICKVLTIEILMLILAAVVTGYAMVLAIEKYRHPHLHMSEVARFISPTAHTITVITASIIFIVVSIVPILRIRKMEPTELIREV